MRKVWRKRARRTRVGARELTRSPRGCLACPKMLGRASCACPIPLFDDPIRHPLRSSIVDDDDSIGRTARRADWRLPSVDLWQLADEFAKANSSRLSNGESFDSVDTTDLTWRIRQATRRITMFCNCLLRFSRSEATSEEICNDRYLGWKFLRELCN